MISRIFASIEVISGYLLAFAECAKSAIAKKRVANIPFAHIFPFMNAIKFIRTQKFQMTQAEFAALAKVVPSSVSRWENGVSPSLEEMKLIRAAAEERGLEWDDKWFFEDPTMETAE